MTEITNALKNSIGKDALVFLLKGFRYEGKIISVFDNFIELDDFKSGTKKIIQISQIAEVTLK